MDSKRVLRVMGWTVLIGAIIFGIIFSIDKVPDYVTSYGKVISYETKFHPLVLLAWVAGGVIGSVWFFAASDALFYLEKTANNVETITNKVKENGFVFSDTTTSLSDPEYKSAQTPVEKVKITQHSDNTPKKNKDEWKCDKCGTVNAGYVSSCGCGRSKIDCLAEQYKKNKESTID